MESIFTSIAMDNLASIGVLVFVSRVYAVKLVGSRDVDG